MTTERRVALKRLGLRLKHGAWQLHGKPQLADDQVDAIPDADWQACVSRWRRNRTK
jgi:hypothetical protein